MKWPAHGLRRTVLPSLSLAVGLLLFLAVPAFAEGGTSTDTETISQTAEAQRGTSTGGGAVTGAAEAIPAAIVQQESIQADGSLNSGASDTNQIASNTATVNQTTAATSGNAQTENGGTAVTGSALAGTLAIVQQLNIQVVAGWVPSGGVTQTASNVANINQVAVADSGDATGSGSGSAAQSGNATAFDVTVIQQRNVQVYVGKKPTGSSQALRQTARNNAAPGQIAAALSGHANAQSSSGAETGNVGALVSAVAHQKNEQMTH